MSWPRYVLIPRFGSLIYVCTDFESSGIRAHEQSRGDSSSLRGDSGVETDGSGDAECDDARSSCAWEMYVQAILEESLNPMRHVTNFPVLTVSDLVSMY